MPGCNFAAVGKLDAFTYHRAWLRYAMQNYIVSCSGSPPSASTFSVQEYSRPFCDTGTLLFYSYEKGTGDPTPRCLSTRKKVVVIDPGHGFECSLTDMPLGAIGTTDFPRSDPPPGLLREDDLTMAIAREFQRLASSKYTVVLTKNSANTCPTYKDRGKTAMDLKADVFVSVHINRANPIPYNPFANGTSAVYNSSRPGAKALANLMAASVSASLGVNNRGAKVDDGLAVLKHTVTPKMIPVLVEAARLSGSDEKTLHSISSAAKVASGIKAALDSFFAN